MKKNVLLSGIATILLTIGASAQTIVSTTPENKNVILEEYTGMYCQYCPGGHQLAQEIIDDNPGDVFAINHHIGGLATPQAGSGHHDYRTSYGNALANQAGVSGIPTASINRQGDAIGANSWTSTVNDVLSESSYVNVGVEAEVNVQTKELTVHVEAYYTGDSPESINKLNVALLQNNTTGFQIDLVIDNKFHHDYNHVHRFVDFLTGQWGEDITTTTEGSFVDETYTYTIPEEYNGVPSELYDMEIVAFIAESEENIISGNKALITYVSDYENDANAKDVKIASQCAGTITPSVRIQNTGSEELTSIDIEYSVNSGNTETHTWNGNLSTMESEYVELPEVSYTNQEENTLTVEVVNDDNSDNNDFSLDFEEVLTSISSMDLTIKTDDYGEETTWDIRDENGDIVESGGPYSSNSTQYIALTLPEGCYQFNLYDSFGDGILEGDPGHITLIDREENTIYDTENIWGWFDHESVYFSTDGTLSNPSLELNEFMLYPNPSSGILNINTPQTVDIEVYDLSGKKVFTQNKVTNNTSINLSKLQSGVYLVKMKGENLSEIKKVTLY